MPGHLVLHGQLYGLVSEGCTGLAGRRRDSFAGMPRPPQSIDWPDRDALLLVHGVGNAAPGHYERLEGSIRSLLGSDADQFAIYTLYYDEIHDWMRAKVRLDEVVGVLAKALRAEMGDEDAAAVAELLGDLVTPAFHAPSRVGIREVLLAQIKQIVRDGLRAGVGIWSQRISIISHSLGCLHSYEALHAAAKEPQHALRPLSNGVTFRNAIFIASPIQLVRSAAAGMRTLMPYKEDFAVLARGSLSIPVQASVTGYSERSVRRWISLTGALDPLGGYLMRRRIAGAFMDVPGQETVIDKQDGLAQAGFSDLMSFLREILVSGDTTTGITARNPHSWQGYIDRNADMLRAWLTHA